MPRFNVMLHYLTLHSTKVLGYINNFKSTTTPITHIQDFMSPSTTRFSASFLALPRRFTAAYKSFQTNLSSALRHRRSFAIPLETRLPPTKPRHIFRRMMGFTALTISLKGDTLENTTSGVGITTTADHQSEKFCGTSEQITRDAETQAADAFVHPGRILERIPGFDDNGQRGVSSCTTTMTSSLPSRIESYL